MGNHFKSIYLAERQEKMIVFYVTIGILFTMYSLTVRSLSGSSLKYKFVLSYRDIANVKHL